MGRKGHEPVRTCIVCNGRKAKWTLVRIAMDPEEKVLLLDHSHRLHGRGAYTCPECLPQLRFSKRLQRAFKNKAKGLAGDVPATPSVC